MIPRFKLIVKFYKQFVVVSLLINLLLLFLKIDWFPAIMVKFLFVGLLLWGIYTTERKQQLDFYRNLRLGPAGLFMGVVILDLLLFVFIYSLGL